MKGRGVESMYSPNVPPKLKLMSAPTPEATRVLSPRSTPAGEKEKIPALSDYDVVPLNGKSALVSGITGQDGSYLAELLLAKVRCGAFLVHVLLVPISLPLFTGIHCPRYHSPFIVVQYGPH